MGKIITVASQKGGVGKTTTVLNLGFSLSRFHEKILLIDGDPQGGIGISSNLKAKTTRGLIDLLRSNLEPKDVMATTRDGTMTFIGAGSLDADDPLVFEEEAKSGKLGSIIEGIATGFDHVILDAPAGIGSIVRGLLSVSDGLILPVNCRTITIKTLPLFLSVLKNVQTNENTRLRLHGILVTIADKRNQHEIMVYKKLKETFPPELFFSTIIPFHELFEKAGINAVPVAMLKGGEKAARSYMDLAMELREREIEDHDGGTDDDQVVGLF